MPPGFVMEEAVPCVNPVTGDRVSDVLTRKRTVDVIFLLLSLTNVAQADLLHQIIGGVIGLLDPLDNF